MVSVEYFAQGLQNVLSFHTIFLMFLGTVVGIIFGAVPGLSSVMALVLFLPFTYTMEPIVGIPFLIAIYIGATSGGLISAILINIPGTPAAVATCLDGHPMTKKGQAVKAIGMGVIFSFIGTILSTLALIFISPPLANIAIKFGPHELFAIAIFSIVLISSIAGDSLIKSLLGALLGMAFATIGIAPVDGVKRYTFGSTQLLNGFDTLVVLIGLFAITEILKTAETIKLEEKPEIVKIDLKNVKGFGFTLKEFWDQKWNCLIAAVVGIVTGIIPGIGGSSSNLIAYSVVKQRSKYPEKFGTGIPDGIVASETANNASCGGAMIPLLSLGIPGDGSTAVLLGAFMVHGLAPGPLLFRNQPELVYTIFVAFMAASVLMVICEFYGLRFFIQALRVPVHILLPVVFVFTTVGAFALSNNAFNVVAILVFGFIGYVFVKFGIPQAPFIIGFILGGMAETNFRRALVFSRNNFFDFFTKPIAAVFIILTVAVLVYSLIKDIKKVKAAVQ